MDKIYQGFKNPDLLYRPAPFWIWNEEMDSKETCRQLQEMKEHGFGGGFAHVRLGLISPYLGEEFFKCWEETLEYCKEHDIKLYMYDENGWPSGSAGGQVKEIYPDAVAKTLKYRRADINEVKRVKSYLFKCYAYDEATNTIGKDVTDFSVEEIGTTSDKFIIVLNSVGTMEDLTNPKTVETFIKITHDEYYRRTGKDFGTVVPAVFSDESYVSGIQPDMMLYTPTVCNKFYEMHGYRLEDNYLAVFENFNGNFDKAPEKVRYDYCCTLGELWIESFIKPITKWCDEHGIAWTGHDQEHSWPLTKGGAYSEQRTYEFRHWPGMDWLLCEGVKNDDAWNDTLLMDEIRSAANQFNKEKTMVEAYGAAGWQSRFRDYKRIGDWLLVHGLNFFVHHLTHYSIIGSRKRDCPQSFDWREPWWDELTEHNDYLSRAGYLLSQGKQVSRILYFNPSTTGYMVPVKDQKNHINQTKGFDAIPIPDVSDFLSVMQAMQDEQWDYDIGDEFSVADNVSYDGNKIKVGAATYDVVLISDSMKNFRKETVEILKTFAANGGKIIATGNCAEYIDAERCDECLAELRKSWTIVDGAAGVIAELENTLTKRLTSSNGWVRGIAHMRRELDDGREVYFFTNHSLKPYSTRVTLKGKSAVKWELYTGEKKGIECEVNGDCITFDLDLEWTQSAMIVVNDVAPIVKPLPKATKEIALNTVEIKAEKPNNIILDNVTLKTNRGTTGEIYYPEASSKLYKAMGMDRIPWLEDLQLHSEFVDKVFGDDTGFEVTYKVIVKEGTLPTSIAAVIERPDLMKLSVNGNYVEWKGEGHYLDYKMGRIDVTPYVREGENEFVVWAEKFNVRDEIEMLILEGDFGVDVEDDRFVIVPKAHKLEYGSWYKQNMPFYPNAVNYTLECELDKVPESAKIVLGKYEASAVSVKVNGEYVSCVGMDGDEHAEIGKFLKAGKNTITVRACASFKNLFGPFINYTDETVATWGEFIQFERGRATHASEYRIYDYGLFEQPKLYINE